MGLIHHIEWIQTTQNHIISSTRKASEQAEMGLSWNVDKLNAFYIYDENYPRQQFSALCNPICFLHIHQNLSVLKYKHT